MHDKTSPSNTVPELLKGAFREYRESTREGNLPCFRETGSD
jgi:hypothetical protein